MKAIRTIFCALVVVFVCGVGYCEQECCVEIGENRMDCGHECLEDTSDWYSTNTSTSTIAFAFEDGWYTVDKTPVVVIYDARNDEVLRINYTDGEIYWRGKLVTTDEELIKGFWGAINGFCQEDQEGS